MYEKLFPGALRKGACAITLATAALVGLTANANAYDLTISTSASQDITSTSSPSLTTFTANGSAANLNVTDLQNAIALTSVKVKTGSSGSQPGNITVATPVSWSSHALTLDAYLSIYVNSQLSASSTAGLTLTTNDGGSGGNLWFTSRATFGSTSEALTINGQSYTLESSIASLASDIASNSSGDYALANNYNASGDGTYHSCVIANAFSGTFNGLGNTISNLTINGATACASPYSSEVGLFATTGTSAVIASINMASETVTGASSSGTSYDVAGIVGSNGGLLFNDFIDSDSQVSQPTAGTSFTQVAGIAAVNGGTISYSQSAATVLGGSTSDYEEIGGVVGENNYSGVGVGLVANSIATGIVKDTSSTQAEVSIGGLVGWNYGGGTVSYSSSTAQVTDTHPAYVGGLVGQVESNPSYDPVIEYSYASGPVSASGSGSGNGLMGGLVGIVDNAGAPVIDNCYANGSISSSSSILDVGGLVGDSYGTLTSNYASGPMSVTASYVGGFIGYDDGSGNSYNYWDTTTTGITTLSQGAGHPANDPGITGLSNSQLQSGLPTGFSATIWAENAGINGGLPYLINNPSPDRYRPVGRHGKRLRAY